VNPEIFKYLLMAIYVIVTLYLSWIGMKKTRDIKGFSIGNKDLSPFIVGVTFAASVASTATFVINPGFIYTHGLSAYMHFGLAASGGILTALLVLTKGFMRVGESNGAITIPDWIYRHYQDRRLGLFFAFINLLSITFVVLILVGCSVLMSSLFPISQGTALIMVLLFVFSYVLMGGTYAHTYTNTLQGLMMVVIAIVLVVQGFKYFDGGLMVNMREIGENYASLLNADSNLYNSFFSVFISGFVITFALMMQPHILTKALYLKSERDANTFIITATIVGLIFSQMLLIGFYARFAGIESVPQDQVVATYLVAEYTTTAAGQYMLAFIFVALLAAGMSTLDGILVSLSAMVVNDIYMPLRGDASHAEGLKLSRYVLVVIGVVAGVLAWDPPELVGIFAQKGVYGLAAATVVPILFGIFLKRPLSARVVFLCAALGLFVHLSLNLGFGVANPAVSATIAIFMATAFASMAVLFRPKVESDKITVE
jgi:SSS family solute:Na+ symporter/sodium/pantothenate symporter